MQTDLIKKYVVNFFDKNGKCYYRGEAVHVDISTYTTLIDFSERPLSNKSGGLFRSYDEMQTIKVIGNVIKIEFISSQSIFIYL